MKKLLVITIALSWSLAGFLTLTFQPGPAESKNIERQMKTIEVNNGSRDIPVLPLGQSQDARKPRYAENPQGTLYGENAGDSIILQWTLTDNATEYLVFRSTSLSGPWELVLRTSQGAAKTGGAKEDWTPKARLMELCYKVEALDTNGHIIELYEPICVPKF